MEIEYKGANCSVITAGKTKIVIDPRLSVFGQKDHIVKGAIQLATETKLVVDANQKLIIDGPGEYEVSGISIKGIPATAHVSENKEIKDSTIYTLQNSSARICVMGNIKGELDEAKLESIGITDILMLPVGGNGYTLDAHEAVSIARQIDAKIIVPTHYADSALKYPVSQAKLEDFLKEFGTSEHEKVAKLKVKNSTSLPEISSIVEITRTT